MRRINKLMAVLLSLTMCLSLLPVSAFADYKEPDYEEKENPGYDIQNHPDYEPAEVEGVLDNESPEEDDTTSAVTDVIMDKVDQEAINSDSTDDLDKVTNVLEAIDQADAADKFQQAVSDAVNNVPEKTAEAETEETTAKDEDGEEITTPDGGTIPVTEIELVPATDKDGNEVTDPEGNTVMVPDVTVTGEDDEVVKDENDNPVSIDQFAQDQADAVATAKGDAEEAAGKAAEALQKAQELTGTEVSAADAAQAREDLAQAQQDAADAYRDATDAAVSAAENYALAEDAVESAKSAYQAAVDQLHAAGYTFEGDDLTGLTEEEIAELKVLPADGGAQALQNAKKAVEDAKLALADAAELKAAAEKQRDYAELYNRLAQTLTGKYDEQDKEGFSEEAFLTETLKKLNEAAGEYGQMSEEQLQLAFEILVGTGENAFYNREHYVKDWLNTEAGKKFMEEYTAKKAEIEKWEIEKKHLDKFFPGYDNSGDNPFWTDEDGNHIPLGDGDLFYKLYFYTFQGGVTGNKLNPDLGAYSQYTKEVQNGLKQYLEAEEFLKAVEKGESSEITAGNQTITYSKDKICLGSNSYSAVYDADGNYKGVKYNSGEPVDIPWEHFVAGVQYEVQTAMANQLRQVYNDFFVKKTGVITKKTEYERFMDLVDANPGQHEELDTFMTYLDFLQYELQFRAKNLEYGAAWDMYKDTVDCVNVVDTLLSGYTQGIPALIKELEKSGHPEDTKVAEILQSMMDGEPSEEIAKAILNYKGALEDPRYKEDPQAIIYQTIKDHAAAKQADAAKAQETLDEAIDRYTAAEEKVQDAQKKLDDLMKKISDGKFQFESAVQTARQQLAAAQTALDAAKDDRDAALADQQAAEADYVAAMQLAIRVASPVPPTPPDPENPDTPDTPDTPDVPDPDDGDDGDDGDDAAAPAELSILDELVPLAAGPVTRAQFVDFLWRHEGSPEADAPTFTDVPADHEFAPAIGWAQANGLVNGYADGTFLPDELVTVSAVRAILDRFAGAFGGNVVDPAALAALTGAEDEAVLNCDEVLAEFFGEEIVLPTGDEAETPAA